MKNGLLVLALLVIFTHPSLQLKVEKAHSTSFLQLADINTFTVSVNTTYKAFIMSTTSATIYAKRNIAIAIDNNHPINLSSGTAPIEKILDNVYTLVNYYIQTVGFTPKLRKGTVRDLTVEVGNIGGGLASAGVYGIAIDTQFMQQTYDQVASGAVTLHQIFFYETFRNFIDPNTFTPAFDYAVLSNAASWGWVDQGFIDITGCLLSSSMGLKFYYSGQDATAFRQMMVKDVTKYKNQHATWDTCLGKTDLLPWDQSRSIDNVWAGILSQLFDMCGGVNFMTNIFRKMPSLSLKRGGPSYNKADQSGARDNFYIAVSLSTTQNNQNQIDAYFAALGFTFTQAAKDYITQNK